MQNRWRRDRAAAEGAAGEVVRGVLGEGDAAADRSGAGSERIGGDGASGAADDDALVEPAGPRRAGGAEEERAVFGSRRPRS